MTQKSVWFGVVVLGAVLAAYFFGLVDTQAQYALRNALFDQYQRWQPRTYADVPVRVVDIDEESLARFGQWPWPRTRLAELTTQLATSQVAVVAFDIVFAEADRTSPRQIVQDWDVDKALRQQILALPDHDGQFAQALSKSPAVVGFAPERLASKAAGKPVQKARFVHLGESHVQTLQAFGGAITSLPAFEANAAGDGALSFVPDSDGVVRRVPLVLRVGDAVVATLAAEALRVAQDATNVVLRWADMGQGLESVQIGALTLPTTAQGELWVHYTPSVPQRRIPAWRVLTGQVDPALLAGHVVLVGSSAQGLMDLRFSPFGLMPGVEAHAQALEQALAGQFLVRPGWARGVEAAALLLAGLSVGLLALRTRALWAAMSCAAVLVLMALGGWWAFSRYGVLLDAATPAVGVLMTFVLGSLWHHFSSEREQRWIKAAFSRYVSPNRVQHLIDHPDDMALGGRRQMCSFVFTDLQGFTSLMEQIDPGEAVALVNAYLDRMIEIAFAHEGTLDRIVGDALAIMFSAPVTQTDHRKRAFLCALEMDAFANQYAESLRERGIPFGQTRIGVHAGEVIVGNFGGSVMFDYRALGDPVNTASRMEAVNKHLGTRICVSEVILADGALAAVAVRPVGRLVLKGKTQPLAVFEPLDSPDARRAPLEDYRQAYAAMQAESADARSRFDALALAWPEDPLVRLHKSRLQAGEHGDCLVLREK
ncbi:MAG: adenylate/guanylate cyclase domain-containing protein [Rhodoferax sp.]